MGAHAVGFDIGSRNSFVSTLSRYGLHMVSNEYGRHKIPTCLAFTSQGRLAGTLAKMQPANEAKNVLRNFTTLLGKPYSLVQTSDLLLMPYDIEATQSGRTGIKVIFANRPWTFVPEQLLAMQLLALKRMTENYTGTELQNVVLSIPVYYTKSQQQAVQDALSIAGLKCEKLLPDTTAIALTYAYYARNEIAKSSSPTYVAFVSVGYSNTQVSICAFERHSLEILSTTYDPDLGGKHFDCAVYEVLNKEFKNQHGSEVSNNSATVRGLLNACETVVKRINMGAEAVTVTADSLSNEYSFCGEIKREKFESACCQLLERFGLVIKKCLQQCTQVQPEAIHSVEMVGGCSRMPALRAIVAKIFNTPPCMTLDVDEAVAKGCAIQAAMCSPLFRYPFKIVESAVSNTPEHINVNPLTQKQLDEFRLVEMEISSLTARDCELANMKAMLARLISQLHERVKQPTPRGSITPVSMERLVSIDTWVKRMGKCGSVQDYLAHIKSLRKLCEKIKTTTRSSLGKSSKNANEEREQGRNQQLSKSQLVQHSAVTLRPRSQEASNIWSSATSPRAVVASSLTEHVSAAGSKGTTDLSARCSVTTQDDSRSGVERSTPVQKTPTDLAVGSLSFVRTNGVDEPKAARPKRVIINPAVSVTSMVAFFENIQRKLVESQTPSSFGKPYASYNQLRVPIMSMPIPSSPMEDKVERMNKPAATPTGNLVDSGSSFVRTVVDAESTKFGSLRKMSTTDSVCRSEGSTKRHFDAVQLKTASVAQGDKSVSRNDSSAADIARASVTPPMTLRISSTGTLSINSGDIFRNAPVLPKPPEPDNLSVTLIRDTQFRDAPKTSSSTLVDMSNGHGHSGNELLTRIPSNSVEQLISTASLPNVAEREIVSKITTQVSSKRRDGDHSFNGKLAALPPHFVQEPVSSTMSLPSDRIYKHRPKSTQLTSPKAANVRQDFLSTADRPWIGKSSSTYSLPATPKATKIGMAAPIVNKTNATGVTTRFASLPPPPEFLGSPASLLARRVSDEPTNSYTRSGANNEIRLFTYRPMIKLSPAPPSPLLRTVSSTVSQSNRKPHDLGPRRLSSSLRTLGAGYCFGSAYGNSKIVDSNMSGVVQSTSANIKPAGILRYRVKSAPNVLNIQNRTSREEDTLQTILGFFDNIQLYNRGISRRFRELCLNLDALKIWLARFAPPPRSEGEDAELQLLDKITHTLWCHKVDTVENLSFLERHKPSVNLPGNSPIVGLEKADHNSLASLESRMAMMVQDGEVLNSKIQKYICQLEKTGDSRRSSRTSEGINRKRKIAINLETYGSFVKQNLAQLSAQLSSTLRRNRETTAFKQDRYEKVCVRVT